MYWFFKQIYVLNNIIKIPLKNMNKESRSENFVLIQNIIVREI